MKPSKSLFLARRVAGLVLLGLSLLVLIGVVAEILGECLSQEIVIENQIVMPKVEIWIATVTGYSSTTDQTDDSPFIMASGKRVRDGIIACPRNLPFSTKVIIKGRTYVCEDRMNKRYTDRFDIWFATRGDALGWGKQLLAVEIIHDNNDLSLR